MPIDLANEREQLEGALSLRRLLTLDELWTAYLDRADGDDIERDLPELQGLVGEMREGLHRAAQYARSTRDELEGMSDEDVARTLDQLLSGGPHNWMELRDRFTHDFDELGLRHALIGACFYVDDVVEEEAALLSDKLARLEEGAFEPGDFRALTKCLLELLAVAGNLAWCFAGHVGCIIGGAQALIGVLKLIDRWLDEKSHCRDLAHEILAWLRERGIEIPNGPAPDEPAPA